MNEIFFTVGPAQMYPTVQAHTETFFKKQLGSVSHRSSEFMALHTYTVEQLRILMDIPDEFEIYFTGSASEIWERIICNCVNKESFHCIQGAFAQRFYNYARALGKHATCTQVAAGETFTKLQVPQSAEVIAITYNETSTGVQLTPELIRQCRMQNSNAVIAVDVVSCAPILPLDFSVIDMAFFSVQKCFGLPAGLGVWIVHPRCIARAKEISTVQSIGAHNTLPQHHQHFGQHQTPSTPNIMGIYLLGCVAGDMNSIGIETLRKESKDKAKYLYSYFEKHPTCKPFVNNIDARSETVITLQTDQPEKILQHLRNNGIRCSSGYGELRESTIRIANFPALPMNAIQQLCAAFDSIP